MDKAYDVIAFLCYLSAGGAAVREHTAFTILLLFTATAAFLHTRLIEILKRLNDEQERPDNRKD